MRCSKVRSQRHHANKPAKALITGTSVGIGRSIAKAFADAGASVACVARREANLNTLVDEIHANGGKAIAIAADVAEHNAATTIVSKVEYELGPVDILVNNAGILRISPLTYEEQDLDIWWRVFEVNVRASVSLVRAVLPSMLARKSGIVMSTTSRAATMAIPVMTAYASSKAALSKFHENLVFELEGSGVLSFAVTPGTVPTDLGKAENAFNLSAIKHPAMKPFLNPANFAFKKEESPESCADMMVTLAADERCKVLNGHHLNADQVLGPVLEEAEKQGKGRIGKERLYLMNVGELNGGRTTLGDLTFD